MQRHALFWLLWPLLLFTLLSGPGRALAHDSIPFWSPGAATLSAGEIHACGIRSNGTVTCWGNNSYGQSSPPAGIFTQVSAGEGHTCGLRSDGTLACWGRSAEGQATPPAGTFRQVSSGGSHSCAIRGDGSVECWGVSAGSPPAGIFLQISAGQTHSCGVRSDRTVACWGSSNGTVPAGSFTQVSAGASHSCAVGADGLVSCWGVDIFGETIPPPDRFLQVSVGTYHSCGLRRDGSAVCWGVDSAQSSAPTGTFAEVTVGLYFSCGVRSDGTAACWGSMGSTLPAGSFLGRTLTAGSTHTCEIRPDGTLACWGNNSWGRSSPPAGTFAQVSAGYSHNCAVRSDGSVICWGYNIDGRCNAPSGTFIQVSGGAYHTCGIRSDGSLACWGSNTWGQSLPPSGAFTQVSAGRDHTCAVRDNGAVACWGNDDSGQSSPPAGTGTHVVAGMWSTSLLKADGSIVGWGYNPFGQTTAPAGPFIQASAGSVHTCGIRNDGTLACWGYNDRSQLDIPSGSFTQVSNGLYHSCAIRSDRTVACWGDNADGQAPRSLDPVTLPNADQLSPYSQTFDFGPNYTPISPNYAVASGLPPGLTLASGSGLLSGQATAAGSYNFTLAFSDANGFAATEAYTLEVDPLLTFDPVPAHGTVTSAGSLNCGSGGSVCSESFTSDTTASLIATADAGYSFAGFGGGCALSFTITGDTVCTASFSPNPYTVGGSVNGLSAGKSVVLANNGGDTLTVSADGGFVFPTSLLNGTSFAVTVEMQPVGETCVVTGGSGTLNAADVTGVQVNCSLTPYTIGGSVSGLGSGKSLVLSNNGSDTLTVAANGSFAFALPLFDGDAFAVTLTSQPVGETCLVTGGSGVVIAGNVTGVQVECSPNPYTIGGNVSGLGAGKSLVLSNNGSDTLTVAANGSFTFALPLFDGDGFAVTITSQPAGETCLVTGGSGLVSAGNVTGVQVICSTNVYRIGGSVSGLGNGKAVVLKNNGGDALTVTANGGFFFPTSIVDGSVYAVTVATQPSGQSCTVTSGNGLVGGGDVTQVQVTCSANLYRIGGSVSGLGSGKAVVLKDNGGDPLTVTGNGAFVFATSIADGSAYAVTVAVQPGGQSCTVSNGSGIVSGGDVTQVQVTCSANLYRIGGSVSGLGSGKAVVLTNNGGDALTVTANGAFVFPTSIAYGSAYAVTIATQPSGQSCTVSNGSGMVSGGDVTQVRVTCSANLYRVGGSVSGLGGGKAVVLKNNGGDALTVAANGAFVFPTSIAYGSAYAVTIATQPSGQNCTVSNGSGMVSGGDVTQVRVTCSANLYRIGGSVSGLGSGKAVVLTNNGGDVLTVTANGAFLFATAVADGSGYQVSVKSQPNGELCNVTNGVGTVGGADVAAVQVTCNPQPQPVPALSFTALAGAAMGLLGLGAGRVRRKAA